MHPYNKGDFPLHHVVSRNELASHLTTNRKPLIPFSNRSWPDSTVMHLHILSKSFKQWLGSIVTQAQALALPMGVAPPEQGFYGSLIIRTSSGLAPAFMLCNCYSASGALVAGTYKNVLRNTIA